MLILPEKQVKKCLVKLIKKDRKVPGFIYLNRLFVPLELKKFHELKTAIPQYKKWLLEQNIFCLILQQSESYSIWCFAPGTAKVIGNLPLSSQNNQNNLVLH